MRNTKDCVICKPSQEKLIVIKKQDEKFLCEEHIEIFIAINTFYASKKFANWNDFFIQYIYNHEYFIHAMTGVAKAYLEIALKSNKEYDLLNALRFRKFVSMRHKRFTLTEYRRLKILWNNLPAAVKKEEKYAKRHRFNRL